MTRFAWTALIPAALAPAAWCADDGLHLPAGKSASLTWVARDAMGFRWDIAGDGSVSDGTNDAYDGGMRLRVNDSSFGSFGSARLSADGTEIEIGPWTNGKVKVWRRVRVDAKAGLCRWIDIFENASGHKATVNCRYDLNMGDATRRSRTTTGGTVPGEKDWGAVTSGSSDSSSRPSVMHLFATPKAKVKPQLRLTQGSDDISLNVSLDVPPGASAALCFFEAQRRPFADAVKLMEEFDPGECLKDVPKALRRILVNMPGASMVLGGVELTRRAEGDLIILADGNEVTGKITDERFKLDTEFGAVTLEAETVVGLAAARGRQRPDERGEGTRAALPTAGGQRVFAVLTDGQIVAGTLAGGPVHVTLAGGSKLAVPADEFVQAAYRISPERPEEIVQTTALLVLRSGQRLAFDDGLDTFDLLCCHGPLSVRRADLRSVELDTPEGGLHRAIFRNGSVLSALLTARRIKGKLGLGLPLDVPRQAVRRFLLPGPPIEDRDAARVTLRNGDVLFGELVDESWTVRSRFGKVVAPAADIAEARFEKAAPGRVTVKLRTGSKIAGKLAVDRIGFAITPGPTLRIHVSQMASVAGVRAATATDAEEKADKDHPPAPVPTMAPRRFPTTMRY